MTHDLEAMFRSIQGSLLAHRTHLDSASEPGGGNAVPVTLVTGFLGAGKSTLLCSVLSNQSHQMTVRAVVNDVGDLPFDPTLVAHRDDLEVELTNGCGCCQDPGDLAATLLELARSGPDLIVLEAAGLADPFALAQIVEADPQLWLDRIVAVVDGPAVERQLEDPGVGPILTRQIDAAHVVVVSHADLLSAARLRPLTDRLAALAPGRTIVSSTLEEPTADVLLPASIRGAALPVESTSPNHDLVTITAKQSSPVSLQQIDAVLQGLPSSVVRCKGLLLTPAGQALVQASPSGWDVHTGDRHRAASGDRFFGATVVGSDGAAVQSALALLGCGSGTTREPVAHTNP